MKKLDISMVDKIVLVVPRNSKLRKQALGSSKDKLYLIVQSLTSIFPGNQKIIEVLSFDEIRLGDRKGSIIVIHEDDLSAFDNSPRRKDLFLSRDCNGLNIILITIRKPENHYGTGEIVDFMSDEAAKNVIGCIHEEEFYNDLSKLVRFIMGLISKNKG